MSEPTTEVALAKLAVQLENLTREIIALRGELAEQREAHSDEVDSMWKKIDANRTESDATQNSLTELKGMLRGGALVLAFFQTVVFGAFFWLFSTVSTQSTAITQLQGYDQQLTLLVKQLHPQKE